MGVSTTAKTDYVSADAGLAVMAPIGAASKRLEDPDFTPEAIARQTDVFLRAGGKVSLIPPGQMVDIPRMTGLQKQHIEGHTRIHITLTTSRQRAAKEAKAKQQWKEHAAQ
jgi:hypothetical protein